MVVAGFKAPLRKRLRQQLCCWLIVASLEAVFNRPVATTHVNQLTLLRGRADAATITRERGTTALRLALVIFEHEEIVGANLKGRAH
jgi:hypothetical protein